MLLRRLLLSLLIILFTAFPFTGFAAQMAGCAHCQQHAPASMKAGTCHEHHGGMGGQAPGKQESSKHASNSSAPEKPDQCGDQCGNCTAGPHIVALHTGTAISTRPDGNIVHAGYRPAHFYRLTEPPLDRPPAPLPA